jgi:hypothetical protein
MPVTLGTKNGLKRAWAWLLPIIHARAKASAAMSGKNLEDWFAEAVAEKLAREAKAGKT